MYLRVAALSGVLLLGCRGAKATLANVAAFGGGVATGAVMARDKGNALFVLSGGVHAGVASAGDERDVSGGISVASDGVGVASADDLGVAAHSRIEVGVFGDDYFFGEIDFEVGPGYLRRGRVGGGVVAGWRYTGYFTSAHTLPVRALAYVDTSAAVLHASGHLSYRSDSEAWDGVGLEAGARRGKVAGSLRYERQGPADVVSLSLGWSLHTRGRRNPAPPPPPETP